MTGRSLVERQELAASLPWVSRLVIPTERCEGVKWGTVALCDLYARGDRPARGIQERSKCKRKGWWQFVAAKPRDPYDHPGDTGTYCWTHLVSQLLMPAEHRRNQEWLDSHQPEPELEIRPVRFPLSRTWKPGDRIERPLSNGSYPAAGPYPQGVVVEIRPYLQTHEELIVQFDDQEPRGINPDVIRHVR